MLCSDNSGHSLTEEKMNLTEKYPFLIKYFTNAVNSNKMAHCILFYGSDIEAQYNLALEIARMLNCKGSHTPECQCLNCNWIRENKHPSVLTYSRFDNRAVGDEGKKGVNISIDQAHEIKNNLLVTSDYHRVFIFCDRDKEDGKIQGLNKINFTEPTANALLKTFEEPPQNTTFFFLTKDKSDVITTVVSRAQCFYVPSMQDETRDYSIVKEVMDGYLELERGEVLDFNDKLVQLVKDNDADTVFIQMQNYIDMLLKSNVENLSLSFKLINDIKHIEQAKKEYRLNMNIQTILETLSFSMIL